MKDQDLKKVINFYRNVIVQQIIKPIEIREIYFLVKPSGMDVPYFQKMRAISVFVQGLEQEVIDGLEDMFEDFDNEQEEIITNDPRLSTFIPEDSAASPLTKDETQSHSEDDKKYSELDILEEQYAIATDANQKRSLKMKINKLKKGKK